MTETSTATLPPLISTEALQRILGLPELRIFDTTVHLTTKPGGGYLAESGRASYESGHIPGAGFIDVGASSCPTRITRCATCCRRRSCSRSACQPGAWGRVRGWCSTTPGSDLVVHARLVHVARVRLRRRAGPGWRARQVAAGRPGTRLEPLPLPAARISCSGAPRGAGCSSTRQAACGARRRAASRPPPPQRPVARGLQRSARRLRPPWPHRRQRINLFARDLLDPATQAFLPPAELRERLAARGLLDGRGVIAYCGGGISATTDAFALQLLGQDDVVIYDASMNEWGPDASLPMESDA